MLATSKMTGLDLVGGSSTSGMGVASMKNDSDSKRSSSTSSEEMLSTPKLLTDSHHHHFSKIAAAAHHAAVQHASATASRSNSENQNNNNESEMLTTPVITTPKTSDIWVSHGGNSSPHLKFEATSPGSTDPRSCLSDLAPREPPSDLPMDSDIGLRSPCEGIVAKRREKFRRKQQSSLSDSNGSCDTPTSENSPRDLSMAKLPTSNNSKPSTPTLVKHSPTLPPSPLPLTPPSFKHPHRPEALRLKDVAELPAHYTPSPLTVPSPNWMAVKHYLEVSGSQLKTPKELDSSVFDFLTPATPRSRLYRDMEARLSPRHSPRMTIPEVPTDLSSQSRTPTDLSQQRLASSSASQSVMKMEEESEAAEDLSISRQSNPSGTSGTPPLQINVQHQQIKQERSPSPLHHGMPPAPELIKIERQMERPPLGLPPPAAALHQLHGNAFDIRMTSGYSGSSTTIPMSHAGQVFRRYIAGESGSSPSNSGAAVTSSNYRDHHNSSPIYHPPQSLGPAWHWTQDEEASVSPPQVHFNSSPVKASAISLKTTDSLMASEFKKAKLETPQKKQRQSSGKSGKNCVGGKSGAKESPSQASASNANSSKRVYSCPHCQRSYDWNYNLNRHLKYECGKENAFQCSKCGRKFPHKQNCVYHLKRKHKIVCDTIDQYMANGLVIFRGSANAGGQHIANPQLNQT